MILANCRVLEAVEAEGGIAAAAKRLHRVRSNVTTRSTNLEASLARSFSSVRKGALHLSWGSFS